MTMVVLPPSGSFGVEMPKLVAPLMKAGMGLSHLMFRFLGDRMKMQGQPLLMLTTLGARTGKRRNAILARFPDPDHPQSWLVIGSAAGMARHPSWCYNLARNPDQVWVEVEKETYRVRPESLHGAERDEAWKRVVAAAPGYRRYETATDREIPIIRLTPDARVTM
jgi:deazaflavin-dependent oxidoreductase (nitroreductase family)